MRTSALGAAQNGRGRQHEIRRSLQLFNCPPDERRAAILISISSIGCVFMKIRDTNRSSIAATGRAVR
jgi:hypothetical protein